MPRVRVQLADGSFKHVNMTREELVRYNTTGELSGDVVNQDNLLLKVLNKNGVFNDAKVSTIEDVDGDLKDFVANQDNIVSFLSSYKTVQEETNGIRMGADQVLMEEAEHAPSEIRSKFYWSTTINFENKVSGSTTVDLLAGELPPGFNIRDTSSNVMSDNTLSTNSKSVQIYGTADMTAVSDYIDSGSVYENFGFIPTHSSEMDTSKEQRYVEILDIEYTDSLGNLIENPTNTFSVGDVIYSANRQDNHGRLDGLPQKSRPILQIIDYEDRNKTKTKLVVAEKDEIPLKDHEGNQLIDENGVYITYTDVMTFVNRALEFSYSRDSATRQRISPTHRFLIRGESGVYARYYDTRFQGTTRPLAKNFYFQLGIKYSGQSDYSDKKWFAIVCVNNYDGTRDFILKAMNRSLLSDAMWEELLPRDTNDPNQEFDLKLYFDGNAPSRDYYWEGNIKDIIGDYVLPFIDFSGNSHQISVTNEILPFQFYSTTKYLKDSDMPPTLSFIIPKGELDWEINLSGTKFYKTQQLGSV
tara:strand:- start:414 stop:1997 length:1584 start_codon:yes stop_codon:yes gene_type:complete